jgi:hypothetical protein
MSPILTSAIGRLGDAAGSAVCKPNDALFGLIPKWYKYLDVTKDSLNNCHVNVGVTTSKGAIDFSNILLIGLALLEGLLRVAGVVAVAFVIYGGIQYVLSQGEPEKTVNARKTIVNAMIGLLITIIAVPLVSFVGRQLGG